MTQTDPAAGRAPVGARGELPFGPVAAVFLAAGIGAAVLGVLTTLAEASEGIKSALDWSKSVGPLMGKTILASAAFAVSWVVLHLVLRDKDLDPRRVFTWTGILVAIGVVGTFPLFFQLFVPE
jgi:hypothetical protein